MFQNLKPEESRIKQKQHSPEPPPKQQKPELIDKHPRHFMPEVFSSRPSRTTSVLNSLNDSTQSLIKNYAKRQRDGSTMNENSSIRLQKNPGHELTPKRQKDRLYLV